MVRASCVTKYGMAPVPVDTFFNFSLGTWSSDGSGVMCDQVRDGSSTSGHLLYLAQLVASFISSDTVANKSSLHIVE